MKRDNLLDSPTVGHAEREASFDAEATSVRRVSPDVFLVPGGRLPRRTWLALPIVSGPLEKTFSNEPYGMCDS